MTVSKNLEKNARNWESSITPEPLNKFLARVAWSFYVCSCTAVSVEIDEPIIGLLNRSVSVAGIGLTAKRKSPGNGAATA
jgi:hypothetical protein